MQITVVEADKGDRNTDVQLIVTIYESDYKKLDHNRDVTYPLIHKYSALLRFEFSKSMLYVSFRRYSSPENNVKLHIRCNKLNFANTFVCPDTWSDWIGLGKLPLSETSSSDGKMHIFQIFLNLCELKNKKYLSLLDDKFFYDIHLVSDGIVPGNVAMHRAVLVSHSSKFKSMLLGEYKDVKDIKIQIKDASHQTLLDLREYIYAGVLPDNNLVDLMDVANEYHFENLLAECVFKIVNMVDSQNLGDYRKIAIDYDIPELLKALDRITTAELAKAVNKLETLKVSQVKGNSHGKDTDTNKRDSQRQDSRSQKQGSQSQKQDSHSQRQGSHSQRQGSNLRRRVTFTDTQGSQTRRRDSESQKSDSHTQKKVTNT